MKKRLAILGMVACIFGLTACGGTKTIENPLLPEDQVEAIGENVVESINQIVSQGAADQYGDDEIIAAALSSWGSAMEDMGTYIGITKTDYDISEKEAILNVYVDGSDHDAIVEIIIDESYNYKSITTNVVYTFGEQMKRAGLNTVIGMFTVFVVLILISLIIYLFNFIPAIQEMFSKKDKAADVKSDAVDNTIAQIIEKEEQTDNLELIAVIAAAIAASEGAASTDGFVVRSIRKR